MTEQLQAEMKREREIPKDWPSDGPIDLSVHDLPHASSSTEWWYINGHCEIAGGQEFSFFASFFRIAKGLDQETKEPLYAHSMTWALIDPSGEKYMAESLVDQCAPELGLEKLKYGEGTRDKRLRRALQEVLERGNVPYPDQMFQAEPFIGTKKLHLDYDGRRFVKQDDGSYDLSFYSDHFKAGAELKFRLEKPPIRHGDNGVVRGAAGEDMFYYFIPRCQLEGEIILNGMSHPIVKGSAWYDHEFGAYLKKASSGSDEEKDSALVEPVKSDESKATEIGLKLQDQKEDVAWNWISVQFDDGYELTAYELLDLANDRALGSFGAVIDPEGKSTHFDAFELVGSDDWVSTRTFNNYPTSWTLTVPDVDVSLEVSSDFKDQEFITLISKPAFWEGRIHVKGRRGGKDVSGVGFVERSGFHYINDLDSFFSAVSKETRKSVRSLLPFDPTFEEVRDMVASEDRSDLMEGVDAAQFVRTMTKPVREITDRGGKAWRSYAALACCDVVGGDSRDFVQWLAMPELMHVGSLIVDDVQDKSTWRRGGKTCHMIYGEPIAINAGTAAYFMGQKLLKGKNLSQTDQLRLYDLYFQSLRAGHTGQAMDLEGPVDLIDDAVRTGDTEALEKRVLSTHRLKTAAPAGSLARMGGVAGGGTEEQIHALGVFFEALGLAFQIIDDVLNLRGFKKGLKSKGEDIAQGKITIPVVKALAVMDADERKWLWELLQSMPDDEAVIADCIDKLESLGAIEACVTQAKDLVNNAWDKMNPLIEDSLQKLMLRAFGWYILERHY